MAFLRHTREGVWQAHVLPLDAEYRAEGDARQLTFDPSGVLAPLWVDGGRSLYYPASDRGAWVLWRISPDGAARRLVDTLFPLGADWTASNDGARLAFSSGASHAEIWRMDLDGGQEFKRLTSSTGARDFNPQYSPDGSKIAFMSARPGGAGVWVADGEGNQAAEVARATGAYAAPPRWSPDGTRLVFECVIAGNEDICVVPAAGGETRRLTRHPARDLFPSWSSDGKWVFVSSDRSGAFRIWRIPADGSEAGAIPLTEGEGYAAVQAPGGGPIYYSTKRRGGQLYRIETVGGPAAPAGSIRLMGRPQSFAVGPTGVYFPLSERPEQWFEVWRWTPDGGLARVARIEKRLTSGFSVSPDGRHVLFAAFQEQFGDIYLVDRRRQPAHLP
jgi:Tol biopolymer transport system component